MTPATAPRLSARGLAAGYPGRRVIEDLDLDFAAGRMTMVIGANACGKSTLLSVLARVNEPSAEPWSSTASTSARCLAAGSHRASACCRSIPPLPTV
nr:hypothetical protein GCM10025699_28280 [Microbacterium flavescens]